MPATTARKLPRYRPHEQMQELVKRAPNRHARRSFYSSTAPDYASAKPSASVAGTSTCPTARL